MFVRRAVSAPLPAVATESATAPAQLAARVGHLKGVFSPDEGCYRADGTYDTTSGVWNRSKKAALLALNAALASGDYDTLVLLGGLPGAGKSTWLNSNHEAGVCYWDATLLTVKARAELIDIAKKHGVDVEAVFLDVPVAVSIERNSEQARGSDRAIKPFIIHGMVKRTVVPTEAEGFARVSIVSMS